MVHLAIKKRASLDKAVLEQKEVNYQARVATAEVQQGRGRVVQVRAEVQEVQLHQVVEEEGAGLFGDLREEEGVQLLVVVNEPGRRLMHVVLNVEVRQVTGDLHGVDGDEVREGLAERGGDAHHDEDPHHAVKCQGREVLRASERGSGCRV